MKLKLFIMLFVETILLTLPVSKVSGCWFEPDEEDYRVSLFNPDISIIPGMEPFYFSTHFLNEDYEVSERYKGDHLQNLKEWSVYCNDQVPIESIDSAVYTTDAYVFLEFAKNQDKHPLQNNLFLSYLIRNGKTEALAYLAYAKKYEHLNFSKDPWIEYQWNRDIPAMIQLINEGKSLYGKCKDNSLKLRYGFQLVRAARFASDYLSCIQLYDSLIEPLHSESILKYWAMAHKASAIYWSGGDKAYTDYLFALVFQHSVEKVTRAYMGFEGNNLFKTLNFCKSPEEKAVVLTLNEIRNPGRSLQGLKLIAETDLNNPKLEILFTREINKLEDWLLTPSLTEMDPASSFLNLNYKSDFRYMQEVKLFAFRMANNKRIHNKAYWSIAAAHLAYLSSDFQTAGLYLNKAKRYSNHHNLDVQIRYTSILVNLHSPSANKLSKEEKLYAELKWLEKHKAEIRNFDRYFSNLMLALAKWYEQKGDVIYAALFQSKVISTIRHHWNRWEYNHYFYYLDEHASPGQLDQLIGLIRKKNKTSLEYMLTEKILKDSLRLLDLSGTLYLRQDNLLQALHRFESIPDTFWNTNQYSYKYYLNSNPFSLEPGTEDQHHRNKADTICYNKREVIITMLDYKEKAKWSSNRKAEYLFRIANAYYNITYYGNSWMMSRYWWSIEDLSRYDSDDGLKVTEENNVYFGCKRAIKWYLKAMQETDEPAFKALCLRMAAKCQWHYNRYISYTKNSDPEQSEGSNKYFTQLQNKYPDFYKELIDECLSLNYYLGKHGLSLSRF